MNSLRAGAMNAPFASLRAALVGKASVTASIDAPGAGKDAKQI
jgi:hypothetical protein